MSKIAVSYPHDTDRDIFREALAYSEATTGFPAILIEKDYYCSLILKYFFAGDTSLVFKGGTCLAKIYAGFYRLSEDLDMVIPVISDISRDRRRTEIEPVKEQFSKLPTEVPGITISEVLKGHNESRQYVGYLEYPSSVINKRERIKLEIGIREPLLKPSIPQMAHTIVVNPFSGQPFFPGFTVHAMDKDEAYAEKMRAALTRKDPAIRDFFDVFYAVHNVGIDLSEPGFLSMVQAKLAVAGNSPVNVSGDRKSELVRQLDGELRPVLRPADFDMFNLHEAFDLARSIAELLMVL